MGIKTGKSGLNFFIFNSFYRLLKYPGILDHGYLVKLKSSLSFNHLKNKQFIVAPRKPGGNSGIKTSHLLYRAHQSVSGSNQIQKAGRSDLSQVPAKKSPQRKVTTILAQGESQKSRKVKKIDGQGKIFYGWV
jgi:hypothetical protein